MNKKNSFALHFVIITFVCLLSATLAAPVGAQHATGGSGTYRSNILWFSWGSHGDSIPQGGHQVINSYNVAGQPFEVTCSVSNIAAPGDDPDLQVYRPGQYFADGLDDLYNVGGTGLDNALHIGLVNRVGGQTVTFDFSCSASLDGAPFPLGGLVFADAETSSSVESIQVTIPAGGTFRVLERFRSGCMAPYEIIADAGGTTYTSNSPGGFCNAGSGPMAVGFIDGATSGSVQIVGGGRTAIALGVMVYGTDYGDAPISYGEAGHLLQSTFTDGTVVAGTAQDVFATGFALAELQMPPLRLGDLVDAEVAQQYSANADGDDITGMQDEDGLVPESVLLIAGETTAEATVMAVNATGNDATLAGWIDFNQNGIFDPDERTEITVPANTTTSTAFTLEWSGLDPIPAGFQSFARFRIATNAAEVASPTGLASDGEVEDYAVPVVNNPLITIVKQPAMLDGSIFPFTTTAANDAFNLSSDTTLSHAFAVSPGAVSVTEIEVGGWELTGITCVNDTGNAIFTYGDNTVDIMIDLDDEVTCTFTNEPRAPACNLAANGSFEIPDIQADPNHPDNGVVNGWVVWRTTTDPIDGWETVSGTVDILRLYNNASDGMQSIDLWGTAPATFQQTFSGLIPGVEYTFSVDYSGLSAADSLADVLLDLGSGFQLLQTLSPAADGVNNGTGGLPDTPVWTITWDTFTHSFTATGTEATIRFVNHAAPATSSTGLFIDNFIFEGEEPCEDYGDAPASYGTLLAQNGARHEVIGYDPAEHTALLMLGEHVSIESDGQPSPGADADDFDDGVAQPIVLVSGAPTTVEVSVTNNTDEVATLVGWIDLGGTGSFDAGDRSNLVTVPANSGLTTHELTFAPPLASGDTYARFRVFPGEVADPQPIGPAAAGEVEDYLVTGMEPEPFVCEDQRGYILFDNPTQVAGVDLVTGEWEILVNPLFEGQSNAWGYNVTDNMLWGYHIDQDQLVRVDADWQVEFIDIAGLPTRQYNVGDVSPDGVLYLYHGSGGSGPTVWIERIDVNPASATYLQLLDPVPLDPGRQISDWAFSPIDGMLYTKVGVNRNVLRIHPETGAVELVGQMTGGPDTPVGSIFMDAAGSMYLSVNADGNLWRVRAPHDNDVTVEFLAAGPATGNNDGARCMNGPLNIDFGDAPDSYGTTLANDGARHGIPFYDEATNTAPLMLGTQLDPEFDGQPSPWADADNFDDGVADPIVVVPNEPTTVTVTVTNNTDEPATLAGWIDLGRSGVFGLGAEREVITIPASSGTADYELTFPANANLGLTYARFRVFPGIVADPLPTGPASAGEVEDYRTALPEQPPWVCTLDGILTQGTNPTNMHFIDMITGDTADGPLFPDRSLNALAYNPADGYLYAWDGTILPSGDRTGIVRIGNDGSHHVLGMPSHPELDPAFSFPVGDIDASGQYWVSNATGASAMARWFRIDLAPGSPTFMQVLDTGLVAGGDLPAGTWVGSGDWAWVPDGGDNLWRVMRNSSNGNWRLWRFDMNTGEHHLAPLLPALNPQGTTTFGAAYADDQFLYVSNNTSGDIFRVDIQAGTASLFTEGPPSGNNDGARCPIPIYTDYGDAPESYGTLLDDNGPRHGLHGYDPDNNTAFLMLGTNVNHETDGQPSAGADADAFDDGVDQPIVLLHGGQTTIEVTVTNNTDEPATLVGWVDLDATGTFDAGDRSNLVTVPANSAVTTHELTFDPGTTPFDTYARFRVFPGVVTDPMPVGPASSGEVEDYTVAGSPVPPLQTCTAEEVRASERWWYFGNNAGIDFEAAGTTATPFTHSQVTMEGSTVVTDTEGQLLFWSNGQTVFDRNSNPMPNGGGLLGDPSATQTVAAFPAINQPGTYFVVTTTTQVGAAPNGRLHYSVVDMSLNGGLGDVTTKNVELGAEDTASEALSAVPNADGTGFWVLTYTNNSPNFLAYEFDDNGPVTGNAVVSVLPTSNFNRFGSININRDLDRLVTLTAFTSGDARVRLLIFDAISGQAAEEMSWLLPTGAGTGNTGYTADFSPDGDYVYASKIFGDGQLYRYRIADAEDGDDVKGSEEHLGTTGTNGGQVRRGPDGRMYVASARTGNALSVVNAPDDPVAPGFVSGGFPLAAGSSSDFGLPQTVTGCPLPVEPLDFGDAPESYGTLLADDGARHVILDYDADIFTSSLMLGTRVDSEPDGFPSPGADGDDNDGIDDEDAFNVMPPINISQSEYTVDVPVHNATGADAVLVGWIDFNRNGQFDADEAVTATVADGQTTATLSWTGLNLGGQFGSTYVRLRIAPAGEIDVDTPTGLADGGEVEDYIVPFVDLPGPPFSACPVNEEPPPTDFSIQERWATAGTTTTAYQTPVVGDLYGNGQPVAVIGANDDFTSGNPVNDRLARNLHIYRGIDGQLLDTIDTPFYSWTGHAAIAIADVTGDGRGEIIFKVAGHTETMQIGGVPVVGRLIAYAYDDVADDWNVLWLSDARYDYGESRGGFSISVADFNGDGVPEVYVGNQIFNAATGERLAWATAGASAGCAIDRLHCFYGASVAADMDDDGQLELVAGNVIYKVDLGHPDPAQRLTVWQQADATVTGVGDGYTSVADINLDGTPDVVVVHSPVPNESRMYVWSGQSDTVLGVTPAFNMPNAGNTGSQAMLGDIDGDGLPEIVFITASVLHAYKFEPGTGLVNKWSAGTNDGSGQTSVSMFDFNNNGRRELVYRDETDMRIMDGSGAAPVDLATFGCISGTGNEMPVIAALDGTREARILVTCGTAGIVEGNLRAYETASFPWANTRPVWNQQAYFVAHINDDLSVPSNQFPHWTAFNDPGQQCSDGINRPLNAFQQQVTDLDPANGCPVVCVPPIVETTKDLTGESGDIDGAAEPGELLTYTITLTNVGGVDAADWHIVDFLDPNVIFVSADMGGVHDGLPISGTVEWEGLLVPADDFIELTITVQVVDPIPDGVLAIGNVAYSPLIEPSPDCDADDPPPNCTEIPTAPDVADSKGLIAESGDIDGVAEAGEELTYEITLINFGGSDAENHVQIDQLDPNVVFVSADNGGAHDGSATGGDVTWTVTVPAADENGPGMLVLTVVVQVVDPIPAGVTEIGNVTYNPDDGPPDCDVIDPPPNCSDPLPTEPQVFDSKDLVAESGAIDGVAEAGEELTYEITLVNTGGTDAENYVQIDQLDANVIFVSADNGGVHDGSATGGDVTWMVTVPADSVLVLTVVVQVVDPIPAGVTEIGNVTYNPDDGPPDCDVIDPPPNCSDPLPTEPQVADSKDLVAESGAIDGVAEAGEELTYEITLTNTGGTDAENYVQIDQLDPNVVFVSADNGGVHDGAATGGEVEWTVTVPAADDGGPGVLVLTVVVQVVDPIPAGVTEIGNVTYNPDDGPPDCDVIDPPPNCSDPLPTEPQVFDSKDLVAESGAIDGVAEAGEELTYEITLTNTGGTDAENYVQIDQLDPNVVFVSADNDGVHDGSATGGEVTWTVTVPAADDDGPGVLVLTVVVQVIDPIPADVTEIGNVTYTPDDGPPDCDVDDPPPNCSDPLPTEPQVVDSKDLVAESGEIDGVAEAGEELTYEITLTNTGGTDAEDRVQIDQIDTNVIFISADNGGVHDGSVTGGEVEWVVTVPAADDDGPGVLVLTIVVQVVDPIPDGVLAIGNVTYNPDDGPPDCDVDDPPPNCTEIPTEPNTRVEKSIIAESMEMDGIAEPGEVLTYSIRVRNFGGADANNVEVNEIVPEHTTYVADGSDAWSCPDGSGADTACDFIIATVPGNGFVDLLFRVQVDDPIPPGVTEIANSVALDGEDPPDCPPDTDPACTVIPTVPQTVISKALTGESGDIDGQIEAGEVLTYTITVTNHGGSDDENVVVNEVVPAHTVTAVGNQNVNGVLGAWSCADASGPGTACDLVLTTVASGETIELTFMIQVDDPIPAGVEQIANCVALNGEVPPNPSPQCVTLPTEPALSVAKTLFMEDGEIDGAAEAGEILVYELVVTNSGGSTAFDEFLREIVPQYTTFIADPVSSPGWDCPDNSPNPTVCDLYFDIDAGETLSFLFAVQVVDPLPDGVTRIANAVGLGGNPPPCPPAGVQCVVTPTVNLAIDKNVISVTPFGANAYEVRYELIVTNTGGADNFYTLVDELGYPSNGVILLDPARVETDDGVLEPGIALNDGQFTPINNTPVELSDIDVPLPTGTSHTYAVAVRIAVDAGQVKEPDCTGGPGAGLFNQAMVVGGADTDADACAPVPTDQPRISLVKRNRLLDANGNGYGDVGESLEYTFEIANSGNVDLSMLRLIDAKVRPPQGAWVKCDAAGTPGNGSYIFDDPLPAGGSITCTAHYTLSQNDVDLRRVTNTATVVGIAPDGRQVRASHTAIFENFRATTGGR